MLAFLLVCVLQGGGLGLYHTHTAHGHKHAHTLDGSSDSYYTSKLPRVTRDIIMDNNRAALPSYDLSEAHEVYHCTYTISVRLA
jgi:hypothetical protein